jgi:hypothetical protein
MPLKASHSDTTVKFRPCNYRCNTTVPTVKQAYIISKLANSFLKTRQAMYVLLNAEARSRIVAEEEQ